MSWFAAGLGNASCYRASRSARQLGSANCRSACRGKSKPRFHHEVRELEEEFDETGFWLEMLRDISLVRHSKLSIRTLPPLPLRHSKLERSNFANVCAIHMWLGSCIFFGLFYTFAAFCKDNQSTGKYGALPHVARHTSHLSRFCDIYLLICSKPQHIVPLMCRNRFFRT